METKKTVNPELFSEEAMEQIREQFRKFLGNGYDEDLQDQIRDLSLNILNKGEKKEKVD